MRSKDRARVPAIVAAMTLLATIAPSCQVVSPQGKAQAPAGAEDAARREVEAAMHRYADLLVTGTAQEVAAAYTSDGELLEAGMDALHGPAAIRAFLEPLAAQFEVEEAAMDTDSVDVFGAVAYQWGRYHQRAAEHEKPAQEYRGRYVAKWQRDTGGTWRIARLLMQPFPADHH